MSDRLHGIAEYLISKGEIDVGRQVLDAADMMEEMVQTLQNHGLAKHTLNQFEEWNRGRD